MNAENNVAYLSDRVKTYRDRWLEEYYRADNLKYHMPSGIHVVDLPQIPEGAPSPTFFPGVETTTQQGANKAPDCIYNCCRSRVA